MKKQLFLTACFYSLSSFACEPGARYNFPEDRSERAALLFEYYTDIKGYDKECARGLLEESERNWQYARQVVRESKAQIQREADRLKQFDEKR